MRCEFIIYLEQNSFIKYIICKKVLLVEFKSQDESVLFIPIASLELSLNK